jgi:23S rRNA pseudouridine1911/1915/1917 synthase
MNKAAEAKNFTVSGEKNRLDRALAEFCPEISRSRIQKDILLGLVSVNNSVATEAKQSVQIGDQIEYRYDAEVKSAATGLVNIPILFENKDILIVDKPPGLPVHPSPGFKGTTLIEELVMKYPELKVVGEDALRPGIVHRLDKDTSGVMLVAKTQKAFEHLKDSFATRRINKQYLALVCGRIAKDHQFLNDPIGRHEADFRKMSTKNPKDSKEAITEIFVKEHYINSAQPIDEYTLIMVKLHTGRTHQIRVHLAALGYPIVGDQLYGKKKCQLPGISRQFLHAESIEAQLPDGTWIEAKSQLPSDLQAVLESLKKI